MSDDLGKDVVSLWDKLKGERVSFETHWQECAQYLLPSRADYIGERAPGAKRMQRIYDATGIWACEQFAAGLHSFLTSPTIPWFALVADSDRLARDDEVQAWLQIATAVLYGLFNSSSHNFASQSNELYLDLGSIGTGVMAVLETPRAGVLFSTRTLKECVVAENDEDRIDLLVRNWQFTAKQAVAKWGKKAGEHAVKMFEKNPSEKLRFLHLVRPRRERMLGRAEAKHKPFQSVYVAMEDSTTIDEGGFDEFPYLVPRFSRVASEVYGRGPGMTALPDVKMLNLMTATVLKSAQKIVDPPLMAPDDGFLSPIKTAPGTTNFYRAGLRPTDRIAPIETKGDVRLGVEMLQSIRQQIIRTFYVEWMIMPSDPRDPAAAGKGITATYVIQQRDEKLRLLSPMLARLQSEFLGPLIERTFNILWRKSVLQKFAPGSPFPPPPQALNGVPLRVEYVSPIALAQRSSALDSVRQVMEQQQMLRLIDPDSPVIIDSEAVMRMTVRDRNAPIEVLKSPDRLKAEADARAQAQAQAQEHMALANVASAARDGASALKTVGEAQQAAGASAVDDSLQEAA